MVARDGTDVETEFGFVDEVNENGNDHSGDCKADKVKNTDVGRADLNRADGKLEAVGTVLTGKNQVGSLLEYVRKTHCSDHKEHIGCSGAADAAICNSLTGIAYCRAAENTCDDCNDKRGAEDV